MNVLKEVLKKDVRPAMGCTEPIAIALACSRAVKAVKDANERKGQETAGLQVEKVSVMVSPSVLLNALGVTIPNTGGEKGCRIAAALGAVGGNPTAEFEVLKDTTLADLVQAKRLVEDGKISVDCDHGKDNFYISATVATSLGESCVTIEGSHTNVTKVTYNGKTVFLPRRKTKAAARRTGKVDPKTLKRALKRMTISDLVALAQAMDKQDRRYIMRGVGMNLLVAEVGLKLGKYGAMLASGQFHPSATEDTARFSAEHIVLSTSTIAACATDARMAGVSMSVMSSGGSGNQGVVAILVPYNVGMLTGVDQKMIEESIALSHLVNSFVKAFTGELTPICGCAIAAGVGAAAAIVYQSGKLDKVGMAINTVIASIGGILCDGAKSGCTLKVLPSVSTCIHAAFFATAGNGADSSDGIIGLTPEETIRNLGQLCRRMKPVKDAVLKIVSGKIG